MPVDLVRIVGEVIAPAAHGGHDERSVVARGFPRVLDGLPHNAVSPTGQTAKLAPRPRLLHSVTQKRHKRLGVLRRLYGHFSAVLFFHSRHVLRVVKIAHRGLQDLCQPFQHGSGR